MPIVTPSDFPRLRRQDFATAEDALAGEWTTLIHGSHYLWSVQVAHLDGHAWDPGWDSSDETTWTQEPQTGSEPGPGEQRSLADLTLSSRLRRPTETSAVWFHVEAHLEYLDLRVTVDRLNADNTRDQLHQSIIDESAGTPTWTALDTSVSDAAVRDNGSSGGDYVPVVMELEGRADQSSVTGYLRHVDVWEAIVSPRAEIPHT